MKTAVKDVMTTQVVAVRSGATFKEMAAALRQYRVSAFPVIDEQLSYPDAYPVVAGPVF